MLTAQQNNHAELVKRAERWLTNTMRCSLVLTEFNTQKNSEIPDAIGWKNSGRTSILVECKTSLSDFYADRKKLSRLLPESGMGTYRYYMCSPDIISENRINGDWGLLWVTEKQIKKIVEAPYRGVTVERLFNEMNLLYMACIRGI